MEPSGSSLERPCAARLNTGSAIFHRLGCATPRLRGAATDRRTIVERARARVGRPKDRRARGSRRSVMVGAVRIARRAGSHRATVELAGAGGSPRTCSVVTPGTARARAQLDRRGARRGSRFPA